MNQGFNTKEISSPEDPFESQVIDLPNNKSQEQLVSLAWMH